MSIATDKLILLTPPAVGRDAATVQAMRGSPQGTHIEGLGSIAIDTDTGDVWVKRGCDSGASGWQQILIAGSDPSGGGTATPMVFTKAAGEDLVIEQYFSAGTLIWEKRFSSTDGIVWDLFTGGPDYFIDSPLRTTGIITAGDGTAGAHFVADVEGANTREWISLFVGGAINWGFRRTSASILLLTFQGATNLISVNPNERVWNFFTGVAMAVLRLTAGSNAIQQFGSVFVDASAANVTMVLPNANRRQVWRIVVTDSTNAVALNRSGGDTINGAAANLALVVGIYFVTQNGLTDNRVHGPLGEAP